MTDITNYKFNCKLCNYKCSCKSEFARHENRKKHIGNLENQKKSNVCNYCNKEFKHQPSLSRHMKTCKKNNSEIWICNYCNKKYSHQATVSTHTTHNCKLNDGTKPYNYRKSSKKKEQQENIHISESEKDLKIKFLEEKIKDKEEKMNFMIEIIKLLKEKYELAA
jgi:hypothetical protein